VIELHHWEPNGESARVMICLAEKGLDFSARYVDVLALEQFAPQFLALDSGGEVPVLVHAGAALSGASRICEYLEESCGGTALMPRAPRERWQVRAWQKCVDDGLSASIAELAWDAWGERMLAGRDTGAFEASVGRIPVPERRALWSAALAGYAPEVLERARLRIASTIAATERALARDSWLSPGGFSLADIAVFAHLNYLPQLCPTLLEPAPRTAAWIGTMRARSAVRAALARGRSADPFAVAAPGPEQIRWG